MHHGITEPRHSKIVQKFGGKFFRVVVKKVMFSKKIVTLKVI